MHDPIVDFYNSIDKNPVPDFKKETIYVRTLIENYAKEVTKKRTCLEFKDMVVIKTLIERKIKKFNNILEKIQLSEQPLITIKKEGDGFTFS